MSELEAALVQAFDARSRHSWSKKAIPEALLRKLYDVVKLGPTSMNSCPARFLFLLSQAARERLARHASGSNRAKIAAAPCVVIIGSDQRFYENMRELFPISHDAGAVFARNEVLAQSTAFRNSTLQGAYLMIAARLLGLDCGPMSGFSSVAVDAEFFSGTSIKSNFLCALGYADDEPLPRLPRLAFEKAAGFL